MSRRVRKFAVLLLLASLASPQLSCRWFSNRGGTSTGSARPAPHFEPGFNVFTPEQDIELGRRSAEEIARQVPLLQDAPTVEYVRRLGARLAERAPGYKFPYQFNVIATRDINAFALPGGFIFVNAGAILAVRNEGELAGIVAHEITHVALRHGTSQASKAYVAQRGIGILERVFGGNDSDLGQLMGIVGGTGANVLFLRFGRTAERQADLEGALIMAEAGYDPRDMASFFETLAKQNGRRVPEFLSDHPDPGDRVESIKEALPSLPVRPNAMHDSRDFEQIKARLGGQRAVGALASKAQPERKGPGDPNDIEPGARPPRPSQVFREFVSDDGSFTIQYPDNWDALISDESNMIFAPAGAHGQAGQSLMVTHGIFTGAVKPQAADLRAATEAFVRQQLGANADFRVVREPQRISLAGREAYATAVAGPSAVSGVIEIDIIYTTATADGRLFYLITMAPEDEFKTYEPTFDQIIASVQLAR